MTSPDSELLSFHDRFDCQLSTSGFSLEMAASSFELPGGNGEGILGIP
jgi:hypothetical protein